MAFGAPLRYPNYGIVREGSWMFWLRDGSTWMEAVLIEMLGSGFGMRMGGVR